MPETIVTHYEPPPRHLTEQENAQCLDGLRVLARIIIPHHDARQGRACRGDDCVPDAASVACRLSSQG